MQLRAPDSGGLGPGDLRGEAVGQAVAPADDGEPHPSLGQLSGLGPQVEPEQPHERGHLRLGSTPVVAGEGEKREHADSVVRRGLGHAADGFHAFLVASIAGETLAGRPAAVAVHDHADVEGFMQSTVHCRVPGDSRLRGAATPTGSGRQGAGSREWKVLAASGPGGVANDLFEDGEVVQESLSAVGGQAAGGQWPVLFIALYDLHQPGFLQDLKMPAEVAVREAAQLFQVGERQALGLGDQGGEDAESGFLMDDAVQSLVGERGLAGVRLGHRCLRTRDG